MQLQFASSFVTIMLFNFGIMANITPSANIGGVLLTSLSKAGRQRTRCLTAAYIEQRCVGPIVRAERTQAGTWKADSAFRFRPRLIVS